MFLLKRLFFLFRTGWFLVLCASLPATAGSPAEASNITGTEVRDALAPLSALPLDGIELFLVIVREGPNSIRFRIHDVKKPRFFIDVDYARGIMDCHIRIKKFYFDIERREAVTDRSEIRGRTFFQYAVKVLDQRGMRVEAIHCLWQPYEGINDVFRQFVSQLNQLENEKTSGRDSVELKEAARRTWIGKNARDYFQVEPVVGFVQCPWKKYEALGCTSIDVVDQVELYLFRNEPGRLTRKRLGIVEGLDSDSNRAIRSSREIIRAAPEVSEKSSRSVIPLEWVAPVSGVLPARFHPSLEVPRRVDRLVFSAAA